MNLIIPMAGRGSRLRPHSLTVPKPVVPVAGKPIVRRLAETLGKNIEGSFDEIAFVIGDFGEEVESILHQIARDLGTRSKIYFQDEPKGPAHAIHCALDSIDGPCIVAFADTLFYGDFDLETSSDGIIWTHRVDDPSSFGVVLTDEDGIVTKMVEKPDTPVSDLAIVGIYYFADSDRFKNELSRVIDENITYKGEYQMTTVLENLAADGYHFEARTIDTWLDCGNKEAVLNAHRAVLEEESESKSDFSHCLKDSVVVPPCYIGRGSKVQNSVVGPYVSIGENSQVHGSIIENSIIQNSTDVRNVLMKDSMIGNQSGYTGQKQIVNIGDYSKIKS